MPANDLSYYDLLGLKPDASHDEITAAYDALMVRIRPNVAQDSASTIRLAAAVKEAFETLGDEDKRRVYDESLRGTAAYGEIWKRSQQSTYLEERNKWFDQQVRRAQSDRQSAHELQAERKQLEEDYAAAAASKHSAELAREGLARAAAATAAPTRDSQPPDLRWMAIAVALVVLIAAGVWARGLIARQSAAPVAIHTMSIAPVERSRSIRAPQKAPVASRPNTASMPARVEATPQRASGNAGTATAVVTPQHSPSAPQASTHIQSLAPLVATAGSQSHRKVSSRPAYACKTVAIVSVTHGGSIVDLSDGNRYQLVDPVDQAQAGGWATGSSVAECAWPVAMKRPASLNVNGYTARVQPAAIVAASASASSSASQQTPACADASITDVSDDGYGLGLSDGHAYAVDVPGHVTASSWLVGDAVSVCSAPARGTTAFTIARSGVLVNVARTQSLTTAARAPTLCVVRLISSLAGDGSRVVFNDGHTYRVDSTPGRAIVAGWTTTERITVCIRLSGGTVYATLAHGSLTAHAIRID